MKRLLRMDWLGIGLVICTILCMSLSPGLPAHAQQPVVKAVLFYSPQCSHCKKVTTEVLPPLQKQYGDQLIVLGIDVTKTDGVTLYRAAVDAFKIPKDHLGVPTLIIGSDVLVGSSEIPAKFPGLIEQYLAQGGVDWPAIPGLLEALSGLNAPASSTATVTATLEPSTPTATPVLPTSTPRPTPTQTPIPAWMFWMKNTPGQDFYLTFKQDLPGNTLAVGVLALMVIVLVLMIPALLRPAIDPAPRLKALLIPLLALLGMGIAGYMTYVEVSQNTAFCGPVGDCNAVQQSVYAKLFGVLPVGVVGLIGYAAILIAWALSRLKLSWLKRWTALAVLLMALIGVLFSIYLTFLEPFIIGSTCLWCIVSALVTTALFVLAVPYFWASVNQSA